MEAWDGPAAIAFTDGRVTAPRSTATGYVRAVGTRPPTAGSGWLGGGRARRRARERLAQRTAAARKLFLVDLAQGRTVPDEETKREGRDPEAVRRVGRGGATARLSELPPAPPTATRRRNRCARVSSLFGYAQEDMQAILAPLARNAEEPVSSMGNDTPIAALTNRKPLLYSYFKQLFAQVTNPPIDSIREAIVMSVRASVGSERNLLDETAEHARQLVIDNPILLDRELEQLRARSTPPRSSRGRSTPRGRQRGSRWARAARSTACATRR